MLGEELKVRGNKKTAGGKVLDYINELKAKKAKNIAEFRDLVVMCYNDNDYLLCEGRTSVSGKSIEPACYIKFSEPFNKSTFKVLDIKGKEIELEGQSAITPKDIIKIFKDFEEEDIADVRAALAEEELSLMIDNETGTYLVYANCLEGKAANML